MNALISISRTLRERSEVKVSPPSPITQFNAFIHRGENGKTDTAPETAQEPTQEASVEKTEKSAPITQEARETPKKRGRRAR